MIMSFVSLARNSKRDIFCKLKMGPKLHVIDVCM